MSIFSFYRYFLALSILAMSASADQSTEPFSATDLARAWEGVPELRRRSAQLKLVPRTYHIRCLFLVNIKMVSCSSTISKIV